MRKFKIKFSTVEQVQHFISIIWCVASDAIIRSEDRKYAVDAHSIMGLYSLDLSKHLILEINGEENDFVKKLLGSDILVEIINE